MWTNVSAGIHGRGSGNPGAGVTARRISLRRMKERQNLGKGDARILHTDDDLSWRCERSRCQNRRGPTLLRSDELRFLFRKGQLTRPGGIGRCQSCEADGSIAKDFALDDRCDFSGGVSDGRREGR